jgi:hypothetical protein
MRILTATLMLSIPSALLLGQQRDPLISTPLGQQLSAPEARERQLVENTRKLKVTMTLDRETYLPGEAAELRVTIANQTLGAIEAYEPLKNGPDEFLIARVVSGKFGFVTQQECCPSWPATSTRWFAPGESVLRILLPSADESEKRSPRFLVPTDPGDYKLFYLYGAAEPIDFRVLPARLSTHTLVPLQRPGQQKSGTKDGYKMLPYTRRIPLAVIEAEGKHYVVASLREGGDILRDNRGVAFGWEQAISPYVRIAASDQPIVSLTGVERVTPGAVADVGKEKLIIDWAAGDGRRSIAIVGPDRKVIP